MPSQLLVSSPPRAWVEIDSSALGHNLAVAREHSGCKIMAVVKAGAYGHGLEATAQFFAKQQVAFLGVANVGEARRLRAAKIDCPIYLLGATWQEERAEILALGATPCLSSLDEALAFQRLAQARGQIVPVHLAIDTGMGRGGFVNDASLPNHVARIRAMPNLALEGIASHLSSPCEDEAFTYEQIRCFEDAIFSLGGPERFAWIHLANSGGLLAYPRGLCNLARPGLMLYGCSPIPGSQGLLRPTMTLKSRITLVRTLPAGHGVSYGRTFVTKQPTRVATVGIGYGDGFTRQLSNRGAVVFAEGRRLPILGRITMDQLMIELPHDSALQAGAEVELFGPNIPVTEVAERAGTIPWEIFTGITSRVTRIMR